MLSTSQLQTILAEKKLKVTTQRVAIYKLLAQLGHASADEIAACMSGRKSKTSVATIYNVLECFADNGIISRLNTESSKFYYDVTPSNHPHVICNKTNKIVDYKDDALQRMVDEYVKEKQINGFKLSSVRIQLIGTFD